MAEKESSVAARGDRAQKAANGKIVVAIIIAIVALTFVFSNVAPATLRFLFIQFTMPAWGWFLAVLLAGVVIGSLFPWFRPRKK
ncbi:LapA family protein [Microbacterium caowuchunii]|uniref:LapA family protein n=1 Tax=Microbacterium caowuchunii TaxID=2614638 RepID=A0A5N0TDD6_9MICO|nr:LapA family protein [Microbacterium caowuchunii]KAA9133005.1 LapA family protein [Microbacterium caowuchunii]